MARKNAAIIAASVLVAFALGLVLGRVIAPAPGADGDPNSQSVLAVDGRGNLGEGAPARRRPFQALRDSDAERPAQEEIEGFAYRRLALDMATDQPRACFQFTEPLDATGETNYADFVRLSPLRFRSKALPFASPALLLMRIIAPGCGPVCLRKAAPGLCGEKRLSSLLATSRLMSALLATV